MSDTANEVSEKLKISTAGVRWNVGVDIQIWFSILAIIALAVVRPSQDIIIVSTLLLLLNLSVAVGLAHKQLLIWIMSQQVELEALRAKIASTSKESVKEKDVTPPKLLTEGTYENVPAVATEILPARAAN